MDSNTPDSLVIRLKVFMDSTGLNNSQFAEMCGVPKPSFSQIITGRNKKVSDILLTQIHDAFPQLNMMWLMFGEGSMLKENENQVNGVSDGSLDTCTPSSLSSGLPYPVFADEETVVDNANFPTDGKGISKIRQENDLIYTSSRIQDADIERVSSVVAQKIGSEFHSILEKPQRKVVRITVFYDDNSYETFGPTASNNSDCNS